MRIDPILTIAKREYLSRVKTKGFWIATLLLPLAMAALTILPSVIAMKTRAWLKNDTNKTLVRPARPPAATRIVDIRKASVGVLLASSLKAAAIGACRSSL